MRITADVIDDEPVEELIKDFKEFCTIQGSTMLTDPSEEGASASSQKVDKQWLTEHLAVMKEQITKDVTEKVLTVVNERLPETGNKCNDNAELPKISEADPKNVNKVEHAGIYCDHCDSLIYGIRYKCRDCKDYDLCETCENIPNLHDVKHVFLKIRYPLTPCFFASKKKCAKEAEDCVIVRGLGCKQISKTENVLSPIKSKEDYCGEMHAVFVCDETVPDGSVFPPAAKFVKKWRVRNLSGHSWNSYTTVRMIYSQPAFQPLHTEVAAPRIDPFDEGVVSVQFTAPKFTGHYESHWELHHMDIPFGNVLWCKIIVTDATVGTTSPSPEISSPRSVLGKNWRLCEYPQLRLKRKSKEEKRKKKDHDKRKVSQIFEVLSLAQEETEDGSLCPRRYVTSHTATPTNTPFDLTPPKSPEPKEMISSRKDSISSCNDNASDVVPEVKTAPVVQVFESDDKVSFSSISSSESDNEFVVIPMPKCFNLSEPFKPSLGMFASESVESAVAENIASVHMNITENETSAKVATSEKVSQETGVPEQAESSPVCQPGHQVRECCYVISNIVRLNESSSSSSVSIIDSSSSSPTEALPITQSELNRALNEEVEVINLISDDESNSAPTDVFPKFPVEVVEADNGPPTYPKTEDGERTIQVLPEGLVTGALLAAATVYNTARGIISSIQPVKSEQEGTVNQEQDNGAARHEYGTNANMEQLIEMGFCNIEQNAYLLQKCNGSVTKVVEELISMSSRD